MMFLQFIIVSYIVGTALFLVDTIISPKGLAFHALGFRFVLWLISPMTAWHGALHYIQIGFRKFTK